MVRHDKQLSLRELDELMLSTPEVRAAYEAVKAAISKNRQILSSRNTDKATSTAAVSSSSQAKRNSTEE